MTASRRDVLNGIGSGAAIITLGSGVAAANGGPGTGKNAGVRVVHASPDAPAVDVFVDGDEVLDGVEFGDVSDYLELERGAYRIQVAPAGSGPGSAVIAAEDPVAGRAMMFVALLQTAALVFLTWVTLD